MGVLEAAPGIPVVETESSVEKLSDELYAKFEAALDDYQEKYSSDANAGFPGVVESTLQDTWFEFAKEKGLDASISIIAGMGEYKNACGFLFFHGDDSIAIYINSNAYLPPGQELPKRFADRLMKDNIKKSIGIMMKE